MYILKQYIIIVFYTEFVFPLADKIKIQAAVLLVVLFAEHDKNKYPAG